VLDRESTFADPEIVKLLKTRLIPVAIDQAYHRRQQDTEGEFYRQIAGQGPRNNFQATTQGFYLATAAGQLLLYNNNRDPSKVRRLLKQKLAAFASAGGNRSDIQRLSSKTIDPRYNVQPPDGGLVVRVRAKVLDGYQPTTDRWQRIFQTALSRDNLWISQAEHKALVGGRIPDSLQLRIARFHLVDNTRGEPPMWKPSEVHKHSLTLNDGQLDGQFQLRTASGDRGYDAQLKGVLETRNGRVVRLDLVAKGQFWGQGRYTGGAPKGRFPLAISFTLADGTDVADRVPPQGSRGWLRGYLR